MKPRIHPMRETHHCWYQSTLEQSPELFLLHHLHHHHGHLLRLSGHQFRCAHPHGHVRRGHHGHRT